MNNFLGNLPTITKNLLIINVLLFLATLAFEPLYGLLGVFYPDSPNFKVWQVISYMFMHGGIGHIFFNMFALVMFGSVIENVLGQKKFFNYYFICGLGALVLQYGVQAFEVFQITNTIMPWHKYGTAFMNNLTMEQADVISSIYRTPLVGASGAIYGLLLAYGYLFPNAELMLIFLPVPIKAKYFIPILIVIEVVLGFSSSGSSIAHLAHVGGALFGFILLKMWGIRRTNYY